MTVNFDMVTIDVRRRWLNLELFKDKTITFRNKKMAEWSSDLCPYLTEGMVVIRNVVVSNFVMSKDQKE